MKRWLRLAGALIVFAALGMAARYAMREQLEPKAALDLLQSVQGQWWAIPAFIVAYVTLTVIFVPVTLFHMVGGAAFGFEAAIVVNVLAFNLTSSFHFWLGRRLGRERVAAWFRESRLAALEDKLSREGLRAVLVARFLPLPAMAANMTAGLSAVRWRDFAIGSFIASLPIIVIYTWFAASLVEGVAEAKQQALVQTLIAAAVIVGFAVVSRLMGRSRSANLGAGAQHVEEPRK